MMLRVTVSEMIRTTINDSAHLADTPYPIDVFDGGRDFHVQHILYAAAHRAWTELAAHRQLGEL